jgi:5-methylcytosine-specific restriction endonuclease McrA
MVDLMKFSKGKQIKAWWTVTDKDLYEERRMKVYNCSKWRKIRQVVFDLHPLCNVCNKADSVDVDHIKPLFIVFLQGLDPYDLDNLQGICKKCHGKKSQEDKKLEKNYSLLKKNK